MKSNKTKSAMTALVIAAMICTAAMPVKAEESKWVNNEGNWSLIKADGKKATGWVKDGDCWYAFDENGSMRTGWVASHEHWYFMGQSGVMQVNTLVEDNGAKYFVKSTGVMAKDYVKDGYEFTSDGKAIPLSESKSVVLTDAAELEGKVIEGNLYVDITTAKEIELKGVTVKGKLVIVGDNETKGKLTLTDSTVETINTQTRNSEVVLSGDTEVKNIVIEETAKVTTDKAYKGKVENFEIQSTAKGEIVVEVPAENVSTNSYAPVDIQAPVENLEVKTETEVKVNADVKNVTVTETAKDTTVEVGKGSTVGTITADAPVKIDGKGTVDKVEANVDGVEAGKDTTIKEVETGKDVTEAPDATKPDKGGSSGGSGGNDSGPTYYTVTFNDNDGNDATTVPSQSLTYGSKITKPENPTKAGAVFAGWFNGDTRWDFDKDTIRGSVTLTAKWAESALDVVDKVEGAEKVKNENKETVTGYYYNVFFANGSDVTVWGNENASTPQLLVKVNDTIYYFDYSIEKNAKDDEKPITIFAGSKNTDSTGSTITVESGYVQRVFGGGYENDVTSKSVINVKKDAEVDSVIGGGTVAQSNGTTAKAKLNEVEINVDGKVRLIYAGGYAAVGPKITDVVNFTEGTANVQVNKSTVTILENADVEYYSGGGYSYGALQEVTCDIYGSVSVEKGYSNVAGTNGYVGKASMTVHEGAHIGQLYSAVRGYVAGDVVLTNEGTIDLLSLNPDGSNTAFVVDAKVIVKNTGTITNAYFDCGCSKSAISALGNYNTYPTIIIVDSTTYLPISTKFWEEDKENHFKLPTYQTIILKGQASLAEGEQLQATEAGKKVEFKDDVFTVVDATTTALNFILNTNDVVDGENTDDDINVDIDNTTGEEDESNNTDEVLEPENNDTQVQIPNDNDLGEVE